MSHQEDPTLRLVANAHQGREEAKVQALGDPSMRLAWFSIPAVDTALGAPTVRLAHKEAQGTGTLTGDGYCGVDMTDKKLTPREAPGLLVSYYYIAPFLMTKEKYVYRDWVMDSGAFSAHNSGAKIDLQSYIDQCLDLMATDPGLTEVFALDQIPKTPDEKGIAEAAEVSLKNTEEMWRQGVPAIPCYHRGEPEDVLLHIAKTYPKIAIGGMVAASGGALSVDVKFGWMEQCFARVWPCRIHGFGVAGEQAVLGLPFHSVDATNWEIAPCAFGNWKKFGAMSVRGSNQDLRSQVRYYLDLEAKARVRWARQMQELRDKCPPWPCALDPDVKARVLATLPERAKAGMKPKRPRKPKAEPQATGEAQPELAAAQKEKAPRAQKAPKEREIKGAMDQEWVDYWAKRF